MDDEVRKIINENTNALANVSIQIIQLEVQLNRDTERLRELRTQERELSGKIEGLESLANRLAAQSIDNEESADYGAIQDKR